MDDEQQASKCIRRGQHVRAWRKRGLYDHHGIAIADSDLKRIEPSIWPNKIEPILIAEQNTCGLRIVSVQEFCTAHELKIVHYSTTPEKVILSLVYAWSRYLMRK